MFFGEAPRLVPAAFVKVGTGAENMEFFQFLPLLFLLKDKGIT